MKKHQTRIEKTFFIILLTVIIVRQITYIAMKEYTWLIPLHFCNISAIIVAYWLYTKKPQLISYVYLFSFLAAAALVYPAVDYSWKNPLYYTFIIDHIILLYVPLYLLVVYQYVPSINEFIKTFISVVVLLLIGYFLNTPLNENFFYLTDKPLFPQLTTEVYMFVYLIVVLLIFSLIQVIGTYSLKKNKIKEPI